MTVRGDRLTPPRRCTRSAGSSPRRCGRETWSSCLGRSARARRPLVRGIGEGLGSADPITSPTFVLARTHPSLVSGPSLVHADAYRLGSAAELDDLDLDFADSVVAVEWGAGLLDGVAESFLTIEIARREGDAPLGEDEGEDGGPEPRTVTISATARAGLLARCSA